MSGGEAPLLFCIVHLSHKRMLTREWFYTGVTRASQRCVVLYTRDGVGNAIGKQAIKGKTREDKIRSFQEAQKIGLAGASVNVRMPTRRSLSECSEEQSGLNSPMTVPASPQDEAVKPSHTIINMKNDQIIIKKESNDEPNKTKKTKGRE